MEDLSKFMETEASNVPDLDWLKLDPGNIDNIPRPMNVEAVPELEKAWSHPEASKQTIIPNVVTITNKEASQTKVAQDVIDGVVNQAKREMMLGLRGKELSTRLASLYTPDVISAAKEDLVKVATEQGLLGSVYVDLSPFDSCKDAAKILGKNKIRTARYVVGNPRRSVCSTHHTGVCKELGKKVVDAVDYSDEMLSDFTTHLRIAGVLNSSESVTSRKELQAAILKKRTKQAPQEKQAEEKPMDIAQVRKDMEEGLKKYAESKSHEAAMNRFFEARPILSFMQNQMLKGKTGSDLKEILKTKFTSDQVSKFATEISKVASLQGLMGNIYVDISYYRDPKEAIQAIKTAATNPPYIIQSIKKNQFDDSLIKVAKETGCTELPRDGKIDRKIAYSYLDDLNFNGRISSDTHLSLKNRIDAGDNVLSIVRSAYLESKSYKRPVRVGGVEANFKPGASKKHASRESLRANVSRAIEAGIPINKIENKLVNSLPTAESIGMVRDVLASTKCVDANCLPDCTTEKYQLSYDATIKEVDKCANCIYRAASACTKQDVRFAGKQDLTKAFLELDPKTAKVQYEENPDVSRMDLQQEYDMSDGFGSGMNIKLEQMHEKKALDVDFQIGGQSLDDGLL